MMHRTFELVNSKWMGNNCAVECIEGDDKDNNCNGDVKNTTLDGKRDPDVLRLMCMSQEAGR